MVHVEMSCLAVTINTIVSIIRSFSSKVMETVKKW